MCLFAYILPFIHQCPVIHSTNTYLTPTTQILAFAFHLFSPLVFKYLPMFQSVKSTITEGESKAQWKSSFLAVNRQTGME